MADPIIGGYKFQDAVNNINDELSLVNKLLSRLLEDQTTALDRARLIAQASLAVGRASSSAQEIQEIGLKSKQARQR